jgi:hypothetical protein
MQRGNGNGERRYCNLREWKGAGAGNKGQKRGTRQEKGKEAKGKIEENKETRSEWRGKGKYEWRKKSIMKEKGGNLSKDS